MPKEEKIEVLSPPERKELRALEAKLWDLNYTLTEEERERWCHLDREAHKERLLNMTSEEFEELESRRRAFEEKVQEMKKHSTDFNNIFE